MYEGASGHAYGHDGLAVQVFNPTLKLILDTRDKAALFTIQDAGYVEPVSSFFTVMGQVWRLDTISEE